MTLWVEPPHSLIVKQQPVKFGGNGHCGSGDIMASVCHVISQNHVTKWSCDSVEKSLVVSDHPVKVTGHRLCVMEIF